MDILGPKKVRKIRTEVIREKAKPTPLPSKLAERAKVKCTQAAQRNGATPARASPSSARSSPVPRQSSTLQPASKHKVRRKSPSHARLCSDSESSDDEQRAPTKRLKTGKNTTTGTRPGLSREDSSRQVRTVLSPGAGGQKREMIHAADLVSQQTKKKAKMTQIVESVIVELQYPGALQCERYDLVLGKDKIDPYTEIVEIANLVRDFHMNPEQAEAFSSDHGIVRKLERARNLIMSLPYRPDPDELAKLQDGFKAALDIYNTTLREMVKTGALKDTIDSKTSLPLNMIIRVLVQVYERCVSPKIETLKKTGAEKDNTYGELLHPFVSRILTEARLKSNHVFIDLGSGVGNVVFQAALEFGCESWGCEMMENACAMAEAQEKEFANRCHLWAIKAGAVHLERGDFMENQIIHKAMKRADVILVNNEVFSPALNEKLVNLFLDLKDGCRIISLKSFVNSKISDRNYSNPSNILDVTEGEYHSGSVNWTDAGGKYYIATKDEKRLLAYAE